MSTQIWSIVAACIGAMFVLFALIFTLKKEKATEYISGFNTLSEKEKKKYDREKISKDWRNKLLAYGIICLAGGALGHHISYILAIVALLIWIFLISRESRFDYREKFKKYKN